VQAAAAGSVDLAEVLRLYRSVGWTAYADHPETVRAALAGSSRVVVARQDGRLVGLARVVSDGATIAYLQDVLVDPSQQRTGVGRSLVTAALAPYASVRQKVLLTDDEPGQRAFYEGLGFTDAAAHPRGPLRTFVRLDG
jgi:GNAT superfamily N-acetyltransferase